MPYIKIGDKRVKVSDNFTQMTREQQDATVDEIAASIGAAPKQEQSMSDTVLRGVERVAGASPAAALSGARRFVGQIPKATLQIGSLLTGQNPADVEAAGKSFPAGKAILEAGDASAYEKGLREKAPISSIAGEAVPSLLLPTSKVLAGAKLGTKMLAGATDALLSSQLAAYDTPEDRAKAGITATAFGGAFPAVTTGAGKVLKPLAKYMPFTNKSRLAAEELRDVRGKPTAEQERAVYNRTVELFGKEDADKLALYEMTGDAGVKNKAASYAQIQTPEGIAQIKEAANARAAAVENKLSSYANTMRLSKRETDYLDKLHKEVLPKTNVDAGSYMEITSDPVFKNFVNKYAKAPKKQDAATAESAMLFQSEVAGMHPQSAAYLDAVRKRLQEKRFDPSTASSDARHYKAAVEKIDTALNKATDGRYAAMKSLQQRDMFTKNLDNEFAAVTKTLREGQSVPDLKDIKKIFRGKNFQELTQEAARLKSGARRVQAERSLQLIQHFVKDADPETAAKNIGRGERAAGDAGGAVSMVGKPLFNFLRGEYNKELSYLIDHPEKYIKELEAIDKSANSASYLPRLSALLGRMQAEDVGKEE